MLHTVSALSVFQAWVKEQGVCVGGAIKVYKQIKAEAASAELLARS